MKRRIKTLYAALVLSGIFLVGAPAPVRAVDGAAGPYDPRLFVPIPILRRHACAADYTVPTKRGVAILSPVESPDHDCVVVGGKPRCVPYYPDWCTHPHSGPRLGIPENGAGYCCPGSPSISSMPMADPCLAGTAEAGSYGLYSGGSKHEEMLLHLGGNAAYDPTLRPADAPGDLIDQLHSGR